MIKRNLLLVLIFSLLIMVGCGEEEIYNPIKKTGYDASPLEIDISNESADEFEDHETFTVDAEELIVRIYPDFDSEIILYLYEGDEVEVVDKITDFEGVEWYTLKLLEYDLYYGFAVADYLYKAE